MAQERIGLIEPGRMGLAMVKYMIKGGYGVTVSDINPEPVKEAEALGAPGAANAAEVGAASDVVIIAVGYDDEVIQVITREDGLLGAMAPGTVIAISSTCSMDTVEDLAAKCGEMDVAIYGAPICRGRIAADEGTLLAVVGAAEQVAGRVRPIYATFCSDIQHIGPVGHGQVAKSVNNLLLWVNGIALIEAGRMCEELGVDLPRLRDAMLISTGNSAALEGWRTMTFT